MNTALAELYAALADSSGKLMDIYIEDRTGAEIVREINYMISELTNVEEISVRQARILRILNGEE